MNTILGSPQVSSNDDFEFKANDIRNSWMKTPSRFSGVVERGGGGDGGPWRAQVCKSLSGVGGILSALHDVEMTFHCWSFQYAVDIFAAVA